MWSAGLVLYELVTGRSQGLAKPRLDYDLVPPPLVPAIQRALAEDPQDRTPTITDLRAQLRRTSLFFRARAYRLKRFLTRARSSHPPSPSE